MKPDPTRRAILGGATAAAALMAFPLSDRTGNGEGIPRFRYKALQVGLFGFQIGPPSNEPAARHMN